MKSIKKIMVMAAVAVFAIFYIGGNSKTVEAANGNISIKISAMNGGTNWYGGVDVYPVTRFKVYIGGNIQGSGWIEGNTYNTYVNTTKAGNKIPVKIVVVYSNGVRKDFNTAIWVSTATNDVWISAP